MRFSSVVRRKRRMSHLALGLGLFAMLATVMVADTGGSRAAGLARLAATDGTADRKSDAVALIAAAGFDRKAVAAATLSPASASATRSEGQLMTSLTLAAVLSILAVFNLGFVRHLRRVYASPRRGAWRRGARL